MAGRAEAGLTGVTVGISRLHHPVLTLGPGRRIGIWFQGCSIRCPGCMARDTWDAAATYDQVPLGQVTSWVERTVDAADTAGEPVEGVTISGGEPFDQPEALTALTGWLRSHLDPGRVDVLVYSGYRHQALANAHRELLTSGDIDVLVTEPYRQEAGPGLRWRGSANQRMIPLTELGERRYAEHVDAVAETHLQVDVQPDGLRIIGVPQPGDLVRFERSLAAQGVTLEDCTWTT